MSKSIVMMDVCGSSAMWKSDAQRMSKVLDKLFAHVTRLVAEHKGVLIKTIGDAFMIAFDDVMRALRFALAFQTSRHTLPLMRIGIAHGPVMTKRWPLQGCDRIIDYFGNTVNVASRLESELSAPGGIAVTPVSAEVMEILRSLPGGAIEHVKAVDYWEKQCDHAGLQGLRRSARVAPYSLSFSLSCRPTKQLKNVKPFKALSIMMKRD
jgi:class 3 adenylate cyclase